MLAEFLLGPLRSQVLSTILLQPDHTWHVREIARHLHALPGSVNRELLRLAEVGILVRHNIGNQAHYRPNPACPILDELSGMLRKTSGLASQLAAVLKPLATLISYSCIFGSVAQGRETIYSDVDLLILGNVSYNEVSAALYDFQKKLKRDINPIIYKDIDFRHKVMTGNPWANAVMHSPKLILIGSEEKLVNLIYG